MQTVEKTETCGFAGAVFAAKCVNLTGAQREIDAVEHGV
jgi:hypothetical protein